MPAVIGQERNARDDSLAQVLIEILCDKELEQIRYRGAISKFYNAVSSAQNAAYYIDSITQLKCHSHYDYLKYYLINRQASILVNLGQYDQAEALAQQVIQSNIEEKYPLQYITPYVIMGWLNREKGRDGLALYFFNIGLELAEKHNVQRSKAGIRNRLAILHKIRGNYELALEYCDKGLNLCEKEQYCRFYPVVLMQKKELCLAIGDTSQYLEYLDKSIESRSKNIGTNTVGELHYFALLAEYHLYYNQQDSFYYYKDLAQEGYLRKDYRSHAMDLALDAVKLEIKEDRYVYNARRHQEIIESFTPDMYDQQLEYYGILISFAEGDDNARLTNDLYKQKEKLSEYKANLIRGNYGYMQEYMIQEIERNKAYTLIESRNKRTRRTSVFVGLLALFFAGASIAFYRLIRSLRTSNHTIDKVNSLLASQKSELEKAVDYKNFLIREIHHRVKNNLQVIDSFLNLQRHTLKGDTEHQFIDMAQDRIHAMSITYNILYDQGLGSEVELKDYLAKLMNHLKDYQDGNLDLSVDVQAEECLLNLDKVHSLGMLLAEIFSNSIKHAFPKHIEMPEKPRIYLVGTTQDSGYQIILGDNGIGLQDNNVKKGMGLELIEANAAKMDATITKIMQGGLSYQIYFSTP